MRRHVVVTAVALVGVLFFLYIWPTRFFYSTLTVGTITFPARVDRFTGHIDVASAQGWQPVERLPH